MVEITPGVGLHPMIPLRRETLIAYHQIMVQNLFAQLEPEDTWH